MVAADDDILIFKNMHTNLMTVKQEGITIDAKK